MRTVLLALVVVGCSSSKQDPPKTTPPPKVVDAAKPKLATGADIAKLLPAKPGLPLAAGTLGFSATKAQAKAAVSGLSDDGKLSLGLAGVAMRVAFHSRFDQVRYVTLSMPRAAAAGITTRWGEPKTARPGRRRTADFWFGPGLQVVLDSEEDPAHLTFWPFTPWRSLLGTEKDRFGWEKTSLLGMDRAGALAAVAAHSPKFRGKTGIDLRLPRHEYREDPTWARLNLKDGVVTAVSMRLDYRPLKSLRTAYLDGIRAKWGQPVKIEGKTTWYGDGRISVEDSPHLQRYVVRLISAQQPAPTAR